MKKILFVFLAIVCIVVTVIIFYIQNNKNDNKEYYAQYVQNKLNFPFDINSIELVTAVDAFVDQLLDIKAYTSADQSISIEQLVNLGWVQSKLPKEFESERLLENNEPFDAEILSCNEKFDCLWIYIDEYLDFYGEKANYGGFENCIYNSPNYVIGLYEPESGQLFFKESDS